VPSSHWDQLWGAEETVELTPMDREVWHTLRASVPIKGQRLVELGAGRGLLSHLALRAGATEVTLIDASPQAIRLAHTLFQPNDPAHFVIADLLQYRPREKFDVAFSSGLIEHFRGPELESIVRLHCDLSSQWVVLIAPTLYHPNALICRTRAFRETYGYERPISPSQMRSLMRGCGLEPIALKRFDPLYNILPCWMLPRVGLPSVDRRLTRWAEKLNRWFSRSGLENSLRDPLRRFGPRLGGLLIAVGRLPD